MSKQLLVEKISRIQNPLILLESVSPNGNIKLKGKLQEAEVKNGNGRVYPKEILERCINEYMETFVKNRTSMGELDHPESSIVNLGNVSHLITNIWWEGNNVMGELELLNTPSGQIAKAIIDSKIPLGISSRGMGSVQQIGETVEVQDDLNFVAWDLVSNPSTPQAFLGLNESLINEIDNANLRRNERINNIITEILCNRTGVCSCEFK